MTLQGETSRKITDLQWIMELTGSCHCHGAEQLDGATCGLGTHWDIVSHGVLYQIPPAICYINIKAHVGNCRSSKIPT